MASEGSAEPSKFSLKTIQNAISEFRNPTHGGTRLIKYSLIAFTAYYVYFKVLKPIRTEREFHMNEEWAQRVVESEQQQSRKMS